MPQQKPPTMLPMNQLPVPKIQPLDLKQIRENQKFQISCFENKSQNGLKHPLQMLQMNPPPLLGLPGFSQDSSFAVIEVEVFYLRPEKNTP